MSFDLFNAIFGPSNPAAPNQHNTQEDVFKVMGGVGLTAAAGLGGVALAGGLAPAAAAEAAPVGESIATTPEALGVVPGASTSVGAEPAVSASELGVVPGSSTPVDASTPLSASKTLGLASSAGNAIKSALSSSAKSTSENETPASTSQVDTTTLQPLQSPNLTAYMTPVPNSIYSSIFGTAPYSSPAAMPPGSTVPYEYYRVGLSLGTTPSTQPPPQPITSDRNRKTNIKVADRSISDFLSKIARIY